MTVERATEERLTEFARGIVTGDYMLAQGDDPDWQASLSLIASAITEHDNVGAVLVPVAPHMGGPWLNGRVPAMTMSLDLVAVEDVPALQEKVDTMWTALHPEESHDRSAT
jgi:hypothetical protein